MRSNGEIPEGKSLIFYITRLWDVGELKPRLRRDARTRKRIGTGTLEYGAGKWYQTRTGHTHAVILSAEDPIDR